MEDVLKTTVTINREYRCPRCARHQLRATTSPAARVPCSSSDCRRDGVLMEVAA